jgi:hypothetical protein
MARDAQRDSAYVEQPVVHRPLVLVQGEQVQQQSSQLLRVESDTDHCGATPQLVHGHNECHELQRNVRPVSVLDAACTRHVR